MDVELSGEQVAVLVSLISKEMSDGFIGDIAYEELSKLKATLEQHSDAD